MKLFKKYILIIPPLAVLLFLQCTKQSNSLYTEAPAQPLPTFSVTLMNLNFENATSEGLPTRWQSSFYGGEVKVDQFEHYSGYRSLRIKNVIEKGYGLVSLKFPLDDAIGHKIRFIGYIKTECNPPIGAQLWMNVVDQNGELLAFDNMNDRKASGSQNWTKYEIELPVDKNAASINFGALLSGIGTVWFDSFSFIIDGNLYTDPVLVEINIEQQNWLKSNLKTFNTDEVGSGFDDLAYLKNFVGSSHIVSLGEGTHGTHEFFKMKHRMVEYLITQMGFNIFAIEANMPECRAINDYILYGKGNVKTALKGLYFWTWNTQEVLDMIEWMRQYNLSGKERIQFYGFDMQTPTVAMSNVEQFIYEVEIEFLEKTKQCYDVVREVYSDFMTGKKNPDYSNWKLNAEFVLNHLISNAQKYLSVKNQNEIDLVIQDARVVLQAASSELRDKFMAENVQWIINHSESGSKIVLWAHNAHVMKSIPAMGGYLSSVYGNDMKVFGFCFHKGNYTAVSAGALGTFAALPSSVGSVEWTFHNAGFSRSMLDLRLANQNDPNSSWITKPMLFRNIGAQYTADGFYLSTVTSQYDFLIFFDQTSSSNLLSFN